MSVNIVFGGAGVRPRFLQDFVDVDLHFLDARAWVPRDPVRGFDFRIQGRCRQGVGDARRRRRAVGLGRARPARVIGDQVVRGNRQGLFAFDVGGRNRPSRRGGAAATTGAIASERADARPAPVGDGDFLDPEAVVGDPHRGAAGRARIEPASRCWDSGDRSDRRRIRVRFLNAVAANVEFVIAADIRGAVSADPDHRAGEGVKNALQAIEPPIHLLGDSARELKSDYDFDQYEAAPEPLENLLAVAEVSFEELKSVSAEPGSVLKRTT